MQGLQIKTEAIIDIFNLTAYLLQSQPTNKANKFCIHRGGWHLRVSLHLRRVEAGETSPKRRKGLLIRVFQAIKETLGFDVSLRKKFTPVQNFEIKLTDLETITYRL